MKSLKREFVDESAFGVYVWQMPDGKVVADDSGHWMLIASKKDDAKKIGMLRDAAIAHGIVVGAPMFLSGHRPISDGEYEEQLDRQNSGLVPDEYDVGAMMDELRYQKEHG